MKAHLMYRQRDFDLQQKLPVNEDTLMQDLGLNALLGAMAGGDKFLFQVAKQAILSGLQNEVDTILYRQAILHDCLTNLAVVQRIYDLAVEAIESRNKLLWLGFGKRPDSILHSALKLLQAFMAMLANLRHLTEEHAHEFKSEGFATLFTMLRTELTDDYLATVKSHLHELQFRDGVLVSAQLGKGNQGTHYVLRKSLGPKPNWFERLLASASHSHIVRIADRDEAGARVLSALRERGIHQVASVLAQSADHVWNFFVMLRTELAFYIGSVHLARQLAHQGVPACFPVPLPPGTRQHACRGLRDVCLALTLKQDVVGNDLDADGKNLVVVTGANQGGKSTFLRSVGVAQLMMQCGMLVTAEAFSADICCGLFTHYKREEDSTMKYGKFNEELSRMSTIVDSLAPASMLLFNESFAATHDREGSEIARQIVQALVESGFKVFFVTHLYELAHGLWKDQLETALFLRAEREADGRRTFKLRPAPPLQTSFGADLYEEIFDPGARASGESSA